MIDESEDERISRIIAEAMITQCNNDYDLASIICQSEIDNLGGYLEDNIKKRFERAMKLIKEQAANELLLGEVDEG